MQGFRNFLEDRKAVVILSECRVASRRLGVAGTFDTAIRYERADSLLDVKTSATVPRIVGPQTSGYKELAAEDLGLKLKKRFCLHLNPGHPRGYKFIALNNAADFSIFVSALNCWRFMNPQ